MYQVINRRLIKKERRKSMKKLQFLTALVLFSTVLQSQTYLTVSWKGKLDCMEVSIDSVQVTNLTKNWTTTVFFPEQSIKLYASVGINEVTDFADRQILVKPNPFSQTAEVNFYVGKEGMVHVKLYDIFGRTVASLSQQMDCGTQQLLVNAGSSGHYFLSIETPTEKRVAKLLSTPARHSELVSESLTYKGIANTPENTPLNPPSRGEYSPFEGGKGDVLNGGLSQKSDEELPFSIGDSLQFVAYATDTSGKLHAYLPQIERIQADKELLFIYNPVSTEDYTLESSDCEWNFSSMQKDSLYVINSMQELLAFITCDGGETPPAIDFTKYTLLLAHGITDNGNISVVSKSLMQVSADCYNLSVEININDTAEPQTWHIAVLAPKLPQNANVTLSKIAEDCERRMYVDDYPLVNLPVDWKNLVTDTFYSVNSDEEMLTFFGNIPTPIDFSKYTLLFALGNLPTQLDEIVIDFFKNYCTNQYLLNATVYESGYQGGRCYWDISILVPKITSNTDITLNIYVTYK